MSDDWRLLLFGGTGAIARSVAAHARSAGWRVVATTRGDPMPPAGDAADDPGLQWRRFDPAQADQDMAALAADAPFDAVCWAQGANLADTLANFDAARHMALYEANVLFVLNSAAALIDRGLLRAGGAKLCVISSIWQERARPDKLSYTITKAAIGGLVRSASVDLASDGHLINGVLPGVLDTPMTAANLSPGQMDMVRGKTLFGALPDLDSVADLVLTLCGRGNRSITGQSVAVDLGMSNASLL